MYTEVLQEIAQPTTIVQIAVKVDKIYEEQSYDGWHCTSVPAAFRRDAQKTSIPVQTCTAGASQIILKMMAMMMMVIYNDTEDKKRMLVILMSNFLLRVPSADGFECFGPRRFSTPRLSHCIRTADHPVIN